MRPTVVLVHGLPTMFTQPIIHWSMLEINATVKRCGYQTAVYRYNGHNESFKYNVAALTLFLQSIRGEIIVVGHSYGGLLACEAAKVRPVKAIITICTPFHGCAMLRALKQTIPWIVPASAGYDAIDSIQRQRLPPPPCLVYSISVSIPFSCAFDICLFRHETTALPSRHKHIPWAEHNTCLRDPRTSKAVLDFILRARFGSVPYN